MVSFYTEKELEKLGLKSYGANVKISRYACFYGADNICLLYTSDAADEAYDV